MELPINPVLPLGGIALILSLVWLTGGLRRARVDEAQARALLAQPELGFETERLSVAPDGAAAIASDEAGRFGLVFPAGAKLAARVLGGADILERQLEAQGDGKACLRLVTKGPAAVRLALTLPRDEANTWLARIEAAP